MNVARIEIARRTILIDRSVWRGKHVPGPISPVPGAPDWLLGGWGYLGRVISVVDLARLGGWGSVKRPVAVLLLVELGRELIAIAGDRDLGDTRIAPPDRSDGLYDLVDTEPPTSPPPQLLEVARLPMAFDAALLRGPHQ
ncbi:MAG: hypothetical protein EXR69_11580 [Myxococcales bacterium]|nr:hypothetical protein [Myxococcales bacterium]